MSTRSLMKVLGSIRRTGRRTGPGAGQRSGIQRSKVGLGSIGGPRALRGGLAAFVLSAATGALAGPTLFEPPPGLEAVDDTPFDALYIHADALSSLDHYRLAPCEVSFRKHWLRDQNSSRSDAGQRLTKRDVESIKEELAKQCGEELRGALVEATGKAPVAEVGEPTPSVLLAPRIVDLDINAPDVRAAGVTRNFATSYGRMTLVLDVLDASSGQLLLRAVDKRRGQEYGYLRRTNSLTNRVEAARILKRWTRQLREELVPTLIRS